MFYQLFKYVVTGSYFFFDCLVKKQILHSVQKNSSFVVLRSGNDGFL
jgi:hypothetical protein